MILFSGYRDQIIIAALSILLAISLYISLKNLLAKKRYGAKYHSNSHIFSNLNILMLAASYNRHRKLFMSAGIVSLGLLFYPIFQNIVFAIILGVCSAAVIDELISSLNKRNNLKLHIQVISLISHMILMLKAGKTVRHILKKSTAWVQNPLKAHLEFLVNELESSIPFNEAMDSFSIKCPSNEIRLLASALKINQKIGGDLIFVLENIIESLRHSLESRSKSKTLTMQSRYSATIISFFPIAALVVLYFLMTEPISIFFSSRFANVILLAGGFLEIMGIFAMKKILGADQ